VLDSTHRYIDLELDLKQTEIADLRLPWTKILGIMISLEQKIYKGEEMTKN